MDIRLPTLPLARKNSPLVWDIHDPIRGFNLHSQVFRFSNESGAKRGADNCLKFVAIVSRDGTPSWQMQ
jgi:hypothetical protein